MKTILITGCAGFIGSNLCRKLLADSNNYIVGVDNYSSGKKENIIDLLDYNNFKFLYKDITEFNSLPFDIDEIYNAACCASPPFYQKYAIETTKACTIGVFNMLDLALKNNAKFLQFSTSEIYGDPLVAEQSETYKGNVNPIGIRSCYDEGKRCAESICFDYIRRYSLDIKVIRIFNTYGPGMRADDGRVISNFINQAITNKDITVYGDGYQTRSFCYIDDLIDGIIRMMSSKIHGPINLGNPIEFTMRELAELVIKLTDSKSTIIYKDLPSDDPTKRKPDIYNAKTLLNWRPKVDITVGLNNTIEYYKEKHKNVENQN